MGPPQGVGGVKSAKVAPTPYVYFPPETSHQTPLRGGAVVEVCRPHNGLRATVAHKVADWYTVYTAS